MGIVTASVKTNSVIDILKTIKGMLKTGWTLDEENEILWKDSPAAFPVGLRKCTINGGSFIGICVKNSAGTVTGFAASSQTISVDTTVREYYLTLYTSPNGSLAISIDFNQNNEAVPVFAFIKNSNTNSTLPTYFPSVRNPSAGGWINLVPGTDKTCNMPEIVVQSLGLNYALVNIVDPYTSTAAVDLYALASKNASSAPVILANGNQRFVRFYTSSNGNKCFYMRYI